MIPESYGIERVDVSALTASPETRARIPTRRSIRSPPASASSAGPIRSSSSRRTIIAGHGRLAAATRLGLQQVPVIRLGHLSDAQRKALVIADNQLALNAGWDEAALPA